MSELNDKLLEIKRQKDEYILPENLKKDVTAFGVTCELNGILTFYSEAEMKEYANAENNQVAAIIDMSDWWYSDSNTLLGTIRFTSHDSLGDDPFGGDTNFHSVTRFYDENDNVVGTFDTTYNKLIADVTLDVLNDGEYRYIVWWERSAESEEWAQGGTWERTKLVSI